MFMAGLGGAWECSWQTIGLTNTGDHFFLVERMWMLATSKHILAVLVSLTVYRVYSQIREEAQKFLKGHCFLRRKQHAQRIP